MVASNVTEIYSYVFTTSILSNWAFVELNQT